MPFKILLRKELSSCLGALSGYAIIASALFIVGVSFVLLIKQANDIPTDMTLVEMFFCSWYFWIILVLSTPLITMRSYAQEKSQGTYETLMTAPVTDLQVLSSKFLGSWIFYAFTWLPVTVVLLLLRFYIKDSAVLNNTDIFTCYFGILLIGALYIAIGCFSSSLTKNQIVAGMLSFVLGMGLFLIFYSSLFLKADSGTLFCLMGDLSLISYMIDYSRGIWDSRALVFVVTMTFLFLFLTYQLMSWRRWR